MFGIDDHSKICCVLQSDKAYVGIRIQNQIDSAYKVGQEHRLVLADRTEQMNDAVVVLFLAVNVVWVHLHLKVHFIAFKLCYCLNYVP